MAIEPLTDKGIHISEKAQQILDTAIDPETSTLVLDRFRPLPPMYRRPALSLSRAVEVPVTKIPYVLPERYVIGTPFDSEKRGAGDCRDLSRWFLADIINSKLEQRLYQERIRVDYVCGTAPRFFSREGATHVWTTMNDVNNNWQLVVDPALGAIYSGEEDHQYHQIRAMDLDVVQIEGLFNIAAPIVSGWRQQLTNGESCPLQGEKLSPGSRILGLSQDGNHCFGLGVEIANERPFLKVISSDGNQQTLHWIEQKRDGDELEIGTMTSGGASLAIDDPIIGDEVRSLLMLMSQMEIQIAA